MTRQLPFIKNDGGRIAAGFKAYAGDCVCRAIVIASGRDYREVYDRLALGNANERVTKRTRRTKSATGRKTAQHGIHVKRKWFKDYMRELGFRWVPTMQIGTGTTVHLAVGELPMGRLVVHKAGHLTCVIDGVMHDTWHCGEERSEAGVIDGVPYSKSWVPAVYGYWVYEGPCS